MIAAAAAGTAVVLVLAVVSVVALTNNPKSKQAGTANAATTSPSTPTPTPSSPPPAAKGPSASFRGVSVKGAADLSGMPAVTSKSSTVPTKLEFKDLVVGKGKAATPESSVTVQYVGVLYKNGKLFDASWTHGGAVQFSLSGVVKGFTQGIGGTAGVPPMKVGGRRIMIMPASLGYGAQASGSIPANSPLVFVVDLKSIDS
ncbi:MAG TPA: FKBP-type peptidyl-prolyl cis-trans isomerase [Actinopolymorphaceae bacterium]|jgi:peptidylprolyl isomerase|nr:FKBP-type peptidyl-prolyl cis-trans isomerase [Actinopolymorphaceae bacterium]